MLTDAGRLGVFYRVLAGLAALACVPAAIVGIPMALVGVYERDGQMITLGLLAGVGGICGALGFGAAAITGRNMDWPSWYLRMRGD
jgi:hypothetical protein